MKKLTVVFLGIGLMALSAYLYVNYSLSTPGFTPAQARDSSFRAKPSESFIDLKPKLILKLQQLVKEGSNGLYNLYFHELKPDILNSKLTISRASLIPDTAVMIELQKLNQLPDEIFRIEADSIWIDGLGLNDVLSKDVIDITTVRILQPTINVYSEKRTNNQKQESKTLYQRLMTQLKHIGIGKLIIHNGTLVSHNPGKNKSTKFNDITVNLTNILIDSTTQFDRQRFLFAKDAEITLKDYTVRTANNLYSFNVGTISIQATRHLLVAKNILLQPRYNKAEFQKHIPAQKERYKISIPSIELKTTDWWNLVNNETLEAEYAQIKKADVQVYLDRRKPLGPMNFKGFPHQLFMKIPLKFHIEKLKVNDLDLVYEEFSKLSNQTGKIYVNNFSGTITNLTNIPGVMKESKTTTVSASGNFMGLVPVVLNLQLDLSNYKSGAFTAQLKTTKNIDGTRLNPVSEPLGLFRVKKGQLKTIISNVSGDNHKAEGEVLMLYDDLHITPMKVDQQDSGQLKRKSVTSFIANTFVLKHENPSKGGQPRKVNVSYTRKSGTFFNLIWKTTFVGILKTIGAPERVANQ